MLAFLMSCAVPGWGEFYTGHPARGRAFMTAEAAIWVAWGGFTVQTGMREDDWREHAEVFAGVPGGASREYYQDIADYIRSEGYDSYNEAVRDDARSLYPDDPAAQDAYFAENGYFGDDAWEWESEDRFREYRRLRMLAGESDRRAFYMTGLAVLNRAVSAIDSAWMARRGRDGAAAGSGPSLSVVPDLADGRLGARTTLSIPF
jgi:nucleoside phosphorylase